MNDTRPPQSAIQFTHPERLYWPDDGVTKEGLADYYAQVWKQMAPFVVNRPLALLRCPEGIEGQRFPETRLARHQQGHRTDQGSKGQGR